MPTTTRRRLPALAQPEPDNPYHLVVVDDDRDHRPVWLKDDQPAGLVPVSTASSHTEGSYVDRAKAFSLRTWQLGTVVAVVAALVSTAIISNPVLSLATLGWIVGAYMVVWLIAFALDTLNSAEGVALFNAWNYWRHMEREQRERFEIGKERRR